MPLALENKKEVHALNVSKAGDIFYLILLSFIYCIFWVPMLNLQPALTPGDMGRDLYAFLSTYEGLKPYHDYFWQYGPLMPFYYAFWLLVGGVNLISVRLGLGVLLWTCSLLNYRALRIFTSPAIAFLFSLPYLSLDVTYSLGHVRLRDITHTFNYLGAVPFLILLISCLWKFYVQQKIRWCYFALGAVLAVSFVRIQAFMTTFPAFMLSLLLFNAWTKLRGRRAPFPCSFKQMALLGLLFTAVFFSAYAFFFSGLSGYWIDQYLTLSPAKSFAGRFGYSPWVNFKHLIQWLFVWDRERLLWLAAFSAFGILGALGMMRKSTGRQRVMPLVIITPLIAGAFNSADYFFDGQIHRLDFWFFPMIVLVLGICAEGAKTLFHRKIKTALGVVIFLAMLVFPYQNLREAFAWRIPERYLDFPHGQAYLGGSLSDVEVIKETTDYILKHTHPSDELLAVPYDPLFYFFSGRRNAVREISLMQWMLIGEAEEREIIDTVERKKVPMILISNRYRSDEFGVGHFGKTHLVKLAEYINRHYEEAVTYGVWEKAGSRGYAVKILKRTTS